VAKCDLCGESCKGIDLVQLRDSYQVDSIVDLCGKCHRWANAEKSRLLEEIAPKMREAIRERAGRAELPKRERKSWWQRIRATIGVKS
jgi:hypothetical protein